MDDKKPNIDVVATLELDVIPDGSTNKYIGKETFKEDGKEVTKDLYTPILDTEKSRSISPHGGKPAYTVLRIPEIEITRVAVEKMRTLVSLARKEVGWFGLVREDAVSNTLLIYDIMLPQQNVTFGETDATQRGLMEVHNNIVNSAPTREEGREIARGLRFWGHSHVNMACDPSKQDDSQMDEFGNTPLPPKYMIRGIFNKHGKSHISLWLYDRGIIAKDIGWDLVTEEELEFPELREEFLVKVREAQECRTYTSSSYNNNYTDKRSNQLELVDIYNRHSTYFENQGGVDDDDDDDDCFEVLSEIRAAIFSEVERYPRNEYSSDRPAFVYDTGINMIQAYLNKTDLMFALNRMSLNEFNEIDIFLPPVKGRKKVGNKDVETPYGADPREYANTLRLYEKLTDPKHSTSKPLN